MIILISGTTHTGKTKLAQKLLEKYHYPYLSIDHLKMGLIRSGNTLLTPNDDEKITAVLWPIVSEMIKTAIENNQNLIIEGCYIPSNWKTFFSKIYLDKIKYLCIIFSDNYIDLNFNKILEHRNDIENRLTLSSLNPLELKKENQNFLNDSIIYNNDYILINSDYLNELNDFLTNKF